MMNVEMEVEKGEGGAKTLVLRIDLAGDFGSSKSGKNIIVASTQGSVSVPGQPSMKVGLNVYRLRRAAAAVPGAEAARPSAYGDGA